MIRYRPFRNTDPPALVEIWRGQPPLRRRAQGLTVMSLERFVFSKPYFEREGLIVAEEAGRPLGFAHAGFGPDEEGRTLSTRRGVVCMLMTAADAGDEVGFELLSQAEAFLRSRGAEELHAGEHDQLRPFYLGLYGGSHPAGVLPKDPALPLLHGAGYALDHEVELLQRPLATFRPVIDRAQMQIRRSCQIEARLDPPARNWWDACTLGALDQTEFQLIPKGSRVPCARALFSEMEVLSTSWGVRACGLQQLEVVAGDAADDHAVFLLGESIRQLQGQGVTLIEAQRGPEQDSPALERLGFEVAERGQVLRKTKDSAA